MGFHEYGANMLSDGWETFKLALRLLNMDKGMWNLFVSEDILLFLGERVFIYQS